MPARDLAPSGAPCWIELVSSDPDRAADFYGAIFGWTAKQMPAEYGGYVNFTKDGVPVAGMTGDDGPAGAPDGWTTYLCTPDAKAATEAAVAAGGRVHMEPVQVMQLGTMGLVADPGGAAVGLWQPGEHRGYGLLGEAGTPVWHELHTRDHAAVLEFYRAVFGWQLIRIGDSDEFRYAQMVVDGVPHAGVIDATAFLPAELPAAWRVYIGVDDVDATLAQAVGLGATVQQPAEDTPFGRLAQLADPTGAVVKLSSLPPA